MATDLAEQLQKTQLEMQALETRNQALERALGQETKDTALRSGGSQVRHRPAACALTRRLCEPDESKSWQRSSMVGFVTIRRLQDEEPTFVPANGWNVFNPTGGLVLVATCSPPRKFGHRQMLSLSLRDMAKVLIVRAASQVQKQAAGGIWIGA